MRVRSLANVRNAGGVTREGSSVKLGLKSLNDNYAKAGKAHGSADGAGSGIAGMPGVIESDFTRASPRGLRLSRRPRTATRRRPRTTRPEDRQGTGEQVQNQGVRRPGQGGW